MSATVTPISVKVCTVVELCPRTSLLLPFGGDIFTDLQMWGVKKGFGWTIVGLSDTDFCHLTANISKTVSRSVTCESEFIISSTSKAWGGSLSNSQGKVATLIK